LRTGETSRGWVAVRGAGGGEGGCRGEREAGRTTTKAARHTNATLGNRHQPPTTNHQRCRRSELFEANFPADFVAEGLDQTRGWFYTLMVLSTALFDRPAFKNLVCNGLVLAADGKKMSKRLKNYPVRGRGRFL
jgi:hypothetical protein